MPVVPFSPQLPKPEKPVEFTSAQEPWMLMAAAQMDAQGRLIDSGALKVGASEVDPNE